MTAEGQVLGGRYRLLSRLGSGGQGSVWKARDELLERDVALKELVPGSGGAGLRDSRVRALGEARAMAKVMHPAIVRIHDYFLDGDDPWIVMDYIAGPSLDTIIRVDPPGEPAVAAIGLTVLRGLRAVHAAGVVHRDVKPANILRAADGSIFLVDFGIAKIDGDTSITGQSRVLGTTEYMAPERIRGRPAGPSADLWSFGVTLFYALAGYSPFLRHGPGSEQATISAILHDEPPPLAGRSPLAGIVHQMLRKDPFARPDAAVVEAGLAAVAGGQHDAVTGHGTSGTRATFWEPPPPRAPAPSAPGAPSAPSAPGADGLASRLRIADAVAIVASSGTDSGVALLLGMASDQAARVLARCPRQGAGQLIQGMAASQPGKAGTILQIFTATLAGELLGHMSPGAAAGILTAMPVAEAARILKEAHPRTAARALSELPSGFAAQLLRSTDERHAALVLTHVAPSGVAAMLAEAPPDLSTRLLTRLSPAFRDLVMRRI